MVGRQRGGANRRIRCHLGGELPKKEPRGQRPFVSNPLICKDPVNRRGRRLLRPLPLPKGSVKYADAFLPLVSFAPLPGPGSGRDGKPLGITREAPCFRLTGPGLFDMVKDVKPGWSTFL